MTSLCLYRASAGELAELIENGTLIRTLRRNFHALLGEMPHPKEVESWGNSIPTVIELLLEAGLMDVQVLLEMKTPITDVRIDMVLVGSQPGTRAMSVVVIENKQWSWVRPAPNSEQEYTARIAAGFCWKWSEPKRDGTLVDDVVIGDWRRPWNSNAKEAAGGVPSSHLWATDGAGFGQIGCIYTAQGFEYDYAGVIFGPDLTWTGQTWRADPEASQDPPVKKAEDFGRLVRNTYRVLATRGMRGAVLYSTDPATLDMFADLGVPVLK